MLRCKFWIPELSINSKLTQTEVGFFTYNAILLECAAETTGSPSSSFNIHSSHMADQITMTQMSKQLDCSTLDARCCYVFDLHFNHKTDDMLLQGEQ